MNRCRKKAMDGLNYEEASFTETAYVDRFLCLKSSLRLLMSSSQGNRTTAIKNCGIFIGVQNYIDSVLNRELHLTPIVSY